MYFFHHFQIPLPCLFNPFQLYLIVYNFLDHLSVAVVVVDRDVVVELGRKDVMCIFVDLGKSDDGVDDFDFVLEVVESDRYRVDSALEFTHHPLKLTHPMHILLQISHFFRRELLGYSNLTHSRCAVGYLPLYTCVDSLHLFQEAVNLHLYPLPLTLDALELN